jgi:hypothetical protein
MLKHSSCRRLLAALYRIYFMRSFITAALILAGLCLFQATPAAAQQQAPRTTAGDLMKLCSSPHDIDYGYCAGYINAVADRMLTEYVGDFRACHHSHIRSQQYIDIFKDYITRFPAVEDKDAALTVAAAMARAFPCTVHGDGG